MVIDFGNSSPKAALFDDYEEYTVFADHSEVSLIHWLNAHPDTTVVMGSVTPNSIHFVNLVENRTRIYTVDVRKKMPIKNAYLTPNTLGIDRIAAASGAQRIHHDFPCLIIDVGTCVTYDICTPEEGFLGGSISPGWSLRARSMHEHTGKLPLAWPLDPKVGLPGKDTMQSLQSGLYHGLRFEIQGFIDFYRSIHQNLHVFLCGGGASLFVSNSKQSIFVRPYLVLEGLYGIYRFNEG